jgi:nucleoside-diphosphate-sugar epimerase
MALQKILITGGTGYLGSSIVKILAKNFEVKLIARNNLNFNNKNIEVIRIKDLMLLSDQWWRSHLKDIKYFIHIAWYVNHSDYVVNKKNLDWMCQTIKIADLIKKYSKVSKFIGIGSEMEYGEGIYKKKIEQQRPYSIYGFSKLTSFHFLEQIFLKTKIDFVWCRVFKLFGGENEVNTRLYPQIIKAKKIKKKIFLRNKNFYSDYLHVDIAAKHICNLLKIKKKKIINISSGKREKIKDFADRIFEEKTR